MGQMGTDALVTGLAIIGIVIIVSALLSGLVDKSGLPQVAVFIFIGAALGPAGFGVFDMQLDSPVLRVVATIEVPASHHGTLRPDRKNSLVLPDARRA